VLCALRRRRPLVVAPAGSEQPLLAEACVRAGVALYCPTEIPAAQAILTAAGDDPVLRRRVHGLGAVLSGTSGPRIAADTVCSAAKVAPVSALSSNSHP
jgi:UDP:flavonoid glycosyltransferase YjiC (YdhE family)